MYLSKDRILTYSNIKTKLKSQKLIDASMIIKKELIDTKRKRDGTEVPVYEFKLNIDFWKKLADKQLNVVIDEAHSIINARRAMSKTNQIVTDWIALIRRILGNRQGQYGELTLISQLDRRIDIICREMANKIVYHLCRYHKQCKKCGLTWEEHSEIPEPIYECPACKNYSLLKFNHKLEIWQFQTMVHYNTWREFGQKSFYKHYMINDIENYFNLYNSLQWDSLFGEYY